MCSACVLFVFCVCSAFVLRVFWVCSVCFMSTGVRGVPEREARPPPVHVLEEEPQEKDHGMKRQKRDKCCDAPFAAV